MRIWSLHPKYLDRQGLLACWRESLLAQKVLCEETRGYRQHPQLTRFKQSPDPLSAIATYLEGLAREADNRGYKFNRSKIRFPVKNWQLSVTKGQVLFEWEHLKIKLARRDSVRLSAYSGISVPECHPIFSLIPGDVESWEKR